MGKREKKITRREFVRKSAQSAITLAALSSGCSTGKSFRDIASNEDDVYEYIVVGSGAGGGPVAANLAKAGFRVLLLEAGSNYYSPTYTTPSFNTLSTEDPKMSWAYFVKHYSDLAMQRRDRKYVEGKGIFYPRAGVLGGCTSHNAMVTMYPDNSDWDNISKMTGDTSWNSQDMRKYWERIERAQYVKRNDHTRNGWDGWLSTEQNNPKFLLNDPKLLAIILSAAVTAGLSQGVIDRILQGDLDLSDPNDWQYVQKKSNGLFTIPKATNNGHRNGTRELILNTIDSHPDKLILKTNSHATKLLFDPNKPNTVIGIEYLEGEYLYRASPLSSSNGASSGVRKVAKIKVGGEVILSTGAFNTPQLLMLSGIGPKSELEKHGIKPQVYLEGVGKNLQDRYEIGVTTELDSPFDITKGCTFDVGQDPCLDQYQANSAQAIYASNGLFVGFIHKSTEEKADPDLCVFSSLGKFTGYKPGYAREGIQTDHFTWAVLKGHTQNTSGSVTLNSGDPLDMPDINFRFFGDKFDPNDPDLNSVFEGVKLARKVNSRLGVQAISKGEDTPGPGNESDEDSKSFIHRECWGHHASCSNRIGDANDDIAVVDSKFRVRGVNALRVVDASVFPRVPGLFIVVPVYMIAEKASDDIIAAARS